MSKPNHCAHMLNYMASQGHRLGKTATVNAVFFMYAEMCGLIEYEE